MAVATMLVLLAVTGAAPFSDAGSAGRIGVESVLIHIFEPDALIRFSHSPSGGGPTPAKDGFNPAWDFQYLMDNYEVGREYGFRMRLVCKPWKDRADVLAEVRTFFGEIGEKR